MPKPSNRIHPTPPPTMSKGDELVRLQNLVDTCFDKLSLYNYSLHDNNQLSSRDSSTVIVIPSPHDSSTDITKHSSKWLDFVSSAKSKLHFGKTVNYPDDMTVHQIKRLESRYKQHFISLETFFTTYISKLEQRYSAGLTPPEPTDTSTTLKPSNTLVDCDTYSYTILMVDAFYWSIAGLRDHEFVKHGGRWYQEAIDRIQARALQYLGEYETIMKSAPTGAMRVALLAEKTRMRIQKNQAKKRWRLY